MSFLTDVRYHPASPAFMVIGGPVVKAVLHVKARGHEWGYAFVVDRDRYSAGGSLLRGSRLSDRLLAHPIAAPENTARLLLTGSTTLDEAPVIRDVMLGDCGNLLVYAWSEHDVEVESLEIEP